MIDLATDPDYAAIIAHVRDHPAEDLPRLALADWLEERDFWAAANYLRFATEFFDRFAVSDEKYQWQIAGGPWPPDSSYDAFPELPRLRGIGRGSWYDVRRGLVHTVCCTPDEWLEHGPTIVRHPLSVVEVVKLDRPPRRVEIPPQVWVWPLVGVVAADEGLPYPLWYIVHGTESGGGEWFKTRKQAVEELSARFIAWAWNPDMRRPPHPREDDETSLHPGDSP